MNRESEKFLASGEGMLKFFRRMFEAGVSLGALMKVVNHDDTLNRAAAYIKAGCPEITYIDGQKTAVKAEVEEGDDPITIDQSMQVLELPELFDFDSIDEQTAKNLGRQFYGDESILLTAPKPQGKQQVKIYLFFLSKNISCPGLKEEMNSRRLTSNPWDLVAYALKHPDFADERSIATQWQDANGKFCYAVFSRWRS